MVKSIKYFLNLRQSFLFNEQFLLPTICSMLSNNFFDPINLFCEFNHKNVKNQQNIFSSQQNCPTKSVNSSEQTRLFSRTKILFIQPQYLHKLCKNFNKIDFVEATNIFFWVHTYTKLILIGI